MKSTELRLQEKVDLSDAIFTGNLVAFNCTSDREIILAIANEPLDYRIYTKDTSSAKVELNFPLLLPVGDITIV